MKKLFLIAFLFMGVRSYAQVSQADFTSIFTQFRLDSMKTVYVNNVRIFYTDGSSRTSYTQYAISETTVEAKATALYIRWYRDKSKKVLRHLKVIPYKSISLVYGGKEELSIDLTD